MKSLKNFILGVAVVSAMASLGNTEVEATPPDTIIWVGSVLTSGVPWGVYVQGNYAYIADRDRLTIIDVTIPSSPAWVSDISGIFISALGIAVVDSVAYLNAEPDGIISDILVSDPANPTLLGWTNTNSGAGLEPKGMSVVNNIAYQPLGSVGFIIIDVSDPSTPTFIDSFRTPGIAVDLFVQDTFVYIADYESLQIVNVANPTNPFRVGSLAMPNPCYDVYVSGSYAYIVCQSFSGNDGSIQVVDITNPSSPNIVANVNNINGDPFDLHIQGNYAYVVAQDHFSPNVEGGVRVIEISNPLSPMLVASYDTPGDPRGVFSVFPYIYVADQSSFQILQHMIVGVEEVVDNKQMPNFNLRQNHPNPFHSMTTIRYSLTESTQISLKVFNISGQLVKSLFDGVQVAGNHKVYWDGKNRENRKVPNGVYFYQLNTGLQQLTKKIVVIQ